MDLYKNEDWGDPKNYDLKITRDGDGMETKYSVLPRPAKDVDPEIMTAYLDANIDLEALLD